MVDDRVKPEEESMEDKTSCTFSFNRPRNNRDEDNEGKADNDDDNDNHNNNDNDNDDLGQLYLPPAILPNRADSYSILNGEPSAGSDLACAAIEPNACFGGRHSTTHDLRSRESEPGAPDIISAAHAAVPEPGRRRRREILSD
jgi:hypothetical protein